MNLIHEKIAQAILYANFFGIKKVLNLEEITTTDYTIENQVALMEILHKGEYEKIQSFEPGKDLFGDQLTVVRFKDEKDKLYYALYYDSIEFWDDPQVFDIFPVVER